MSYDLLGKKSLIPIIILLSLGSMGLGVNNTFSDGATNSYVEKIDKSMFDHVTTKTPHLGVESNYDYILDRMDRFENKQDRFDDKLDDISYNVQKNHIILCSSELFSCD